jgi:hypothetical protein
MKKVLTVLTAAAMLFSSVAFATDSDQVNARVKAAFLSDFSSASNVTWEKISACYVATFTMNQLETSAAYNEDGELVGTSREIASTQLPMNISVAIAKKYEGYSVSKKSLELVFDGLTNYYLAVENDHQLLKLKCSISGNIEVESKTKKK